MRKPPKRWRSLAEFMVAVQDAADYQQYLDDVEAGRVKSQMRCIPGGLEAAMVRVEDWKGPAR